MIKAILVTLDGSPVSEAVLPYVAALASRIECRVTLAHAIDMPVIDVLGEDPELWLNSQEYRDGAVRGMQEYLDRQAERLRELSVSVETRLLRGKAVNAILEYAEKEAPDLIAMSTAGRSGLSRILLGSVAERVLQGVSCPLLLVHPKDETPGPVARLTDIVVPLDSSAMAESILPLARCLAKWLDLDISLVNAVPTLSQLYLGTEMVAHPADILDRAEDAAEEYLQSVARRITEEDGPNVRWQVLHGDAGSAIVEFARDLQDTLIAISTHGRSGLERWVLGSVTDRVVRSSGDPVIVIRPTSS